MARQYRQQFEKPWFLAMPCDLAVNRPKWEDLITPGTWQKWESLEAGKPCVGAEWRRGYGVVMERIPELGKFWVHLGYFFIWIGRLTILYR